MTIRFTERKMDVSPELRAYAEKKCEKLDKFFDRDSSAAVTFSQVRGRHSAEITVQSAGMYFRAEEQTTDMYASVDGAVNSIERQIMKNKTRLEKRLRRGAFEKEVAQTPEIPQEDFDLVRVKRLTVKPMTVDDAILQMNLLGHEFFFFINSDENGVPCVVYKRRDGGYGLLISDKQQ